MAKPTPERLQSMVEREGKCGAPRLKKRRDYNVAVAFRGFLLVFVFSWKFLTPIQLKLCKTQTGCRYRALYRRGPLCRPRVPQRFSTSFLGPLNSPLQLLQLTFNWDSFKSIIRSRAPVRPRRPRSAWRGWKMACLWRPRSASPRAQSASSSVERRWQQGLVRPRHRCNRPRPAWRGHEIRSCSTIGKLLLPWVQLPKHPLHLKKLASSTRKVRKSFWGMIPTNSTARPHHIKSKNKRNQGRLPKISAAHGNCRRRSRRQEQQAHPSAKPATSAANSGRV